MNQTEFLIELVQIGEVTKHPNADTLSITQVNGYPVIFRTGDFKTGDEAVYIPVDAMVPTDRPEFAFLKKEGKDRHRIKAMRLRGIFSMGLLVPVPSEYKKVPCDPLTVILDITKYEPPQEKLKAAKSDPQKIKNAKKAGGLQLPVYGLDPLRRHDDVIPEGEPVVLTEKIHGTNARFCFTKGRLWVGSHKVMRGCTHSKVRELLSRVYLKLKRLLGFGGRTHLFEDKGDVWWQIAEKYDLKTKLEKYPNFVLYGEIYGDGIQDLHYDAPNGLRFRAFDVYDLEEKRFLDWDDFLVFIGAIGLATAYDVVPVLTRAYWNQQTRDYVKERAEGLTTLTPPGEKPHTIEGVVVKPLIERQHPSVGRVALKYVGQQYLLRKEG